MSNSNLTKKLLPSKKAWKNIKNNFQFKSRTSKFVKAIKALKQRFLIVYRSISPLFYSKFRALTNRPPPRSHHHHHDFHQSFSAIFVDELFQGSPTLLAETIKTKENMVASSSSTSVIKETPQVNKTTYEVGIFQKHHVNIESVRISVNPEKGLDAGKGKAKAKAKASEISKNPAATDKWKIPFLPQFRGVDERAEEFITKFRQDMKLQREQSILDFQEMLKRSV